MYLNNYPCAIEPVFITLVEYPFLCKFYSEQLVRILNLVLVFSSAHLVGSTVFSFGGQVDSLISNHFVVNEHASD